MNDQIDIRLQKLFEALLFAKHTFNVTAGEALDVVRTVYRSFEYDKAVKKIRRRRLEVVGRQKRKTYTPTYKQTLYDDQQGICSRCKDPLFIPARRNEVDHIDPNARPEDYEKRSNHRLVHPKCNQSKGANSLIRESKKGHGTIMEQLS